MLTFKFKLSKGSDIYELTNKINSTEFCFYIPKDKKDFYIASISENYFAEFEIVFKGLIIDIEEYNPSKLEIVDWFIDKSIGYSIYAGRDDFDIFGNSVTIQISPVS